MPDIVVGNSVNNNAEHNIYIYICKDPLLIGDKTHAHIALTPIRDKILICQTFRSILRPSSVAMYKNQAAVSIYNLVRNAKGW